MKTKSWYAHGKLLITGEYLVLEGAKALAIPLKLGQYLSVKKQKEDRLNWHAMKPDGLWFQSTIQLLDLDVINTTDENLSAKLKSILHHTRDLNPTFLKGDQGQIVETILEFDPEYGFGSSSTLIANLAKWAGVDAFELQKITFGGSGYDIACASSKTPILYQLENGMPKVEKVYINFPFADQLYFVFLGNKQKSIESINTFKTSSSYSRRDIESVDSITQNLLYCGDLAAFELLLKEHELIMSKILKRKPVQNLLFSDHKGIVKSLGGWGGDFVLMTNHSSREEFEKYLNQKGFDTYYRFSELVL